MDISLTPASEQFIQQRVAAGESVDTVINKALEYWQSAEQRRLNWLRAELQKGEDSGDPIPYTSDLLDQIEQEALAEIAVGNTAIDPHVWR